MFARHGEVETTGALVEIDGEWTFQIEFDDGLIMRAEPRWTTKEAADASMRAWIDGNGGRCNPIQ